MRESLAAVAAGWQVDVVCMNAGDEASRETIDRVDVYRLPARRGTRSGLRALVFEYIGFAVGATVLVARLHRIRRYRVVQIHNPPDFLIVAGLLPKLLGARLVFDVHDFAPELFALRIPSARASRLYPLLEAVERFAARTADAVVTVHAPYERALREKGVPAERITVVMNSLDERLLPAESIRRDQRFIVVHHGTMNQHYGIDVVIRAFPRLQRAVPGALLEFHGTGDVLTEARGLVRDLGLQDSVRMDGILLPQRIVLRLVQRASVGVVANLAIERNLAVLPVKLLEYVALKIPVVASDLPGIREFFGGDEVLYYAPGNADALAAALVAVAREPEAASRRAEAAYSRYGAYRWAVNAERYVRLLEELVAESVRSDQATAQSRQS